MVVIKSKSHPDLLFYGRGGKLTAAALQTCGDSVSSLEVAHDKQEKATPDSPDRSVIGGLLWKLLLSKELPTNSDVNWPELQKKHHDLANVSCEELKRYHAALTSIIILDDTIDARCTSFLNDYKGYLLDVSPTITHELSLQSPDTFTAFVADFNDNLAYAMKPSRDFPPGQQDEYAQQLHELKDQFQSTLKAKEHLEIQASFLKTEYKTIAQPAHVDFPWACLKEQGHDLWLAFFGLTQEGMLLQVWPNADGCQGQLVYCPLGKLLILPSDTIHGGGFRTQPIHHPGNVGNLRYHLYLAMPGASLPRFANNTYTMPHDKRYELSEVCGNAPHLEGDDALLVDLLLD